VLEDRHDGPSDEGAVRAVTSQSYASLPWPEGLTALKKVEAERCRVNALCCLLLWLRETRGIAFERIQRYLQTAIWAPAARRHRTDSQKLRVLMKTRDAAGIAVACSELENQILEYGQQAADSRRAEERAAMRVKELEDERARVEAQIEAAKAEIERLTEGIDSARRAHENERAHIRDDHERLRGRVLHRLREELSLLEEGLHALRREPPKVHVMEDHAERAINGLKREMEQIKGDD
jgi:chromosome segregation ATPase